MSLSGPLSSRSGKTRNPSMLFKPFAAAQEALGKYEQSNPAALAIAEQTIGGLLIADGVFGTVNPFSLGRKEGLFGSLKAIAVGVIMLVVVSLFGGFMDNKSLDTPTTATVTNVSMSTSIDSKGNRSTTCAVSARYAVQGRTYENGAASSSSSDCGLRAGDSIQIRYNAHNPVQFDLESNIKGIGAFFTIFRLIVGLIILSGIFTFITRLVTILFGYSLLRRGRGLAARHPDAGLDVEKIKSDAHDFFMRRLWGFNA